MGKCDELKKEINEVEELLAARRSDARRSQAAISVAKKKLRELQGKLLAQKIVESAPKPTALQAFHENCCSVRDGELKWFKATGFSITANQYAEYIRTNDYPSGFQVVPPRYVGEFQIEPGGQLYARLPTREELQKLLDSWFVTESWRDRIELASGATDGGPLVGHHACRRLLKLVAGLFGVPLEAIVELSCPDGVDANSYRALFVTPSVEK